MSAQVRDCEIRSLGELPEILGGLFDDVGRLIWQLDQADFRSQNPT
jgi:hypothetical protein